MQLKKISDQTIVITGATSGIGLTTARRAAKQGAKLVLVARNENALRKLAEELNAGDTQAIFYAADVADEAALRGVAAATSERFGSFDTWINNAGVSIYGKIEDIATEDMRRLFDTNFWGVVYGSRIAAQFLRANNNGGAIINVGSVLSDRAISFQGIYSASKHAVKGFTDAFRMELEAEKLPISVTLIKPSAINTPYAQHAKNYFDKEATLPPPVFAPDLVAEAILHCAENQERDFTVGEGKLLASAGQLAPRLTDKMMEWGMAAQQFKNEPKNPEHTGTLYESHSDLSERGNYDGMVLEESIYQRAKLNPLVTSAILIGGAALTAFVVSKSAARTRDKNARGNERELMQIGHS
ncbi:MAG: SDR family oxidoreductase [Pyrinomonadaceae bacterium]